MWIDVHCKVYLFDLDPIALLRKRRLIHPIDVALSIQSLHQTCRFFRFMVSEYTNKLLHSKWLSYILPFIKRFLKKIERLMVRVDYI